MHHRHEVVLVGTSVGWPPGLQNSKAVRQQPLTGARQAECLCPMINLLHMQGDCMARIRKMVMGSVRIRHSSHDFGWQSRHSVDLAGWQTKMASIEIWIAWRNAHKPHLSERVVRRRDTMKLTKLKRRKKDVRVSARFWSPIPQPCELKKISDCLAGHRASRGGSTSAIPVVH